MNREKFADAPLQPGRQTMRRILFWFVPLALACGSAVVLAYGFYRAAAGGAGQPVGEPPARIARAEATAGSPLQVILLGDSVARGTGDASGLGIGGSIDAELAKRKTAKRPTINLAVNGARTSGLLDQLSSRGVQRLITESDVVVISIGGNDLFAMTDRSGEASMERFESLSGPVLDRVEAIVARIREVNPNGRIFLLGLYNPFAGSEQGRKLAQFIKRWNAKLEERFDQDTNLTVVETYDIFSHKDRLSFDRFHPGDEAYAIIGRRIAEAL